MALGDYVKNTYINDSAPGISAARLNNNENKTDELDAAQAAHQADYVRNPGYAVDTGAVNAYVVTLNPAPTAYVDGMQVMVKIANTNTAASVTLNVNSLGAKGIWKANNTLLVVGDLIVGDTYLVVWNTTHYKFMLVGGNTDATKLGGVAASGYATAAQGTLATNAVPKGLATAADQVMVSTGIGVWAVKTLATFKTWLGLGSAAYTASTAYATTAQGTLATNAMPKLGGTFSGIATAQNNTSYTVKQIRNIVLSTTAPSGGVNGDIWMRYV